MFRNEKGQTIAEYVVLLAVIALASILTVKLIDGRLNKQYNAAMERATEVTDTADALSRLVIFNTEVGIAPATQKITLGQVGYNPGGPVLPDGYTFHGWYLDEEFTQAYNFSDIIKKNVNLYAKLKCRISWVSEGLTIKTEYVDYGTKPSYTGVAPTKESTAQYNYYYSGWIPTVVTAEEPAIYRAKFDTELRKYTVTWVNYNDDVVEIDKDLPYGEMPVYAGDVPEKQKAKEDDGIEYVYSFKGWEPEVDIVEGDVTYKAVFNKMRMTYKVEWVNYDNSPLETDEAVPYGETPEYNGSTPDRFSDDPACVYQFKGWSPAIANVTGNVVYKATFNTVQQTYKVTWLNYDGTVLETDTGVPYGTLPEYNGSTPSRAEDSSYIYQIAGWTPTISNVTGDITYTATYTPVPKTYTITWKNVNGNVLEIDYDVPYGNIPEYNGEDPTYPWRGNVVDGVFTEFLWAGTWKPAITEVVADTTYIPQYYKHTYTP